MRFTNSKRRQPPAVIIISLIDVLIVMLIFLMVTTTFKQYPALKLALPESKQQPKEGVDPKKVIITIAKKEPFFYFGTIPVTWEQLQERLANSVRQNPQVVLAIRMDQEAPGGKMLNVIEAAQEANLRSPIQFFTLPRGKP